MITGYLLGVDVGTTSIKVAIINEKAQLLGMSSSSYKLITPDQDSVQIDTEDMWRAYLKCIRLTLLIEKGPNWLKKFSEVLYAVVVVGFFGFMIVYGWQVVQQQIMMNEMGTALKIPMSIIGICQPVAGVLGIIGVLQSFLEYHGKVAITGQQKEEKIEGGEE